MSTVFIRTSRIAESDIMLLVWSPAVSTAAGLALTSVPTCMSSGRMPRPWVPSSEIDASLMISSPAVHAVCRCVVPGCGPRSRRIQTAGSGSTAIAPISVRRISGRCFHPESATPCWNSATASALSSGVDSSGCRSCGTSTSVIRVRAQ